METRDNFNQEEIEIFLDDIYTEIGREMQQEYDVIDSLEEAFMEGYAEAV